MTFVRAATAAMGTRFEIVVASDDDSAARVLLEEAVYEIETLNARLTRFSRDSLLSHINRTAWHTPARLDLATFDLFSQAAHVHAASDGAFDVTLGSGGYLLDPAAYSISLGSEQTRLDLGGIAKGFALDRAAALLRAGGIDSALLHGGTSSVLAIGSPPGAHAWRIRIAHTHDAHVELCDNALSVSRPYAQIHDGSTHIIDPRSARSRLRDSIAIVTAPSATLADAWSTAVAVLGRIPDTDSSFHAEFAE